MLGVAVSKWERWVICNSCSSALNASYGHLFDTTDEEVTQERRYDF